MAIKKERVVLAVFLTAILFFFLFQKGFLPGNSSKTSPYKSLQLLGSVVGLVKAEYIVEVNPEKTMIGALQGLVDSLDILSSYLDKRAVIKYNKLTSARFYDAGLILSKDFGAFPVVVGVVENSPAEAQGLKIGDTISRLDGKSTLGMSLTEINLGLKSSTKEPVKVKVLRDAETPELSIERTLLFDKPFSFTKLAGTCGVLRLHSLYPPCVEMIKAEVVPLIKAKKEPLVVDLRNCHEGEIDEALKFINIFHKADKIGYFEKHKGAKEIVSAPEDAPLGNMPVIIWTNQATIGPAEAITAVLREMRKANIIGIPTPGLAAAQQLFPLDDGSALLLTTGIFFPVSGNKLWRKGIEPDINIDIKNQKYSVYVKSTQAILPQK